MRLSKNQLAAKKAWATRRKNKKLAKPKKWRTVIGFYKDREKKTRPITKPIGELRRKKVIQEPTPFKGISPKTTIRFFKSGKTVAFVKKEGNKFVMYHYFDGSLQYRQEYNNRKDAIGDFDCLKQEFAKLTPAQKAWQTRKAQGWIAKPKLTAKQQKPLTEKEFKKQKWKMSYSQYLDFFKRWSKSPGGEYWSRFDVKCPKCKKQMNPAYPCWNCGFVSPKQKEYIKKQKTSTISEDLARIGLSSRASKIDWSKVKSTKKSRETAALYKALYSGKISYSQFLKKRGIKEAKSEAED